MTVRAHHRAPSVAGAVALATVLGVAGTATAEPISSSGDVFARTYAFGAADAPNAHRFSSASLPSNGMGTAMSGTSFAQSTYSIGQSGFQIAVDHMAGADGGATVFSDGTISFTADQSQSFTFDASYEWTGAPGNAFLYGYLVDETTGEVVFSNAQWSEMMANGQLALGGEDGNLHNEREGENSGELVSGHSYSLYYFFGMWHADLTDQLATAQGNLLFGLGSPTPIPLPSAALMSCGVFGLCAMRRRRPMRQN